MRLDTPLHGNNARGTKYAVYYASVVTHTVFENIKWLRSALWRNRNVSVPSLASLFPGEERGSRKKQLKYIAQAKKARRSVEKRAAQKRSKKGPLSRAYIYIYIYNDFTLNEFYTFYKN